MRRSARFFLLGLLALAVGLALVAWSGWWWVMQRSVPMDAPTVDYMVEQGMGPRQIARQMTRAGIALNEDSFVLLARYAETDKSLKAGAYQAQSGDTLWDLLQRMVDGDMLQTRITFVEGWTFARMLEAMSNHPDIKNTLSEATPAEIAQELDMPTEYPEGLFYPDTYVFVPGTTDLVLLQRAHEAQQNVIDKLWEQRDSDLPIKTPYEALVLASIVEKETGHTQDRERVAGVFVNRLRTGMLLQTDPTVIYGMGERYQGRIRKVDLNTDNPWNTYTRPGLPPTPIALPGKASILAVLHPEKHDYFYFVSRGDGSSEFSKTLREHNRAVAKYILKRN
ncbi:MAG TPA: endolytic transglycosylase MltG [Paenalcaligenes sp.]|nr:endolytic transglycosylase MltG [Paenalcaligenes sp.]